MLGGISIDKATQSTMFSSNKNYWETPQSFFDELDNMDRRQCLVHRWKDKPDATILIECMKALYSKKTNRKGCWIIGKAQGKRIQAH